MARSVNLNWRNVLSGNISTKSLTYIASIIGIATGMLSIILSFYSYRLKNTASENDIIKEQIQRVDLMSSNLKEMIDFLDAQKKKITEEQFLLENIQQQRKELEPLLNMDKKIVENILNAQTKYERKNLWIDWAIAFLLGVASSMFATLLVRKIVSKKEKDAK